MRVMLTGASGFIGKNLRESFLGDKYEIVSPTHTQLELSDEDAVRDFIVKGRFDAIIHAAAKPGHRAAKDREGILLANSRMFFNIARNSDYFGKLIITGSGAIYDMRHYEPRMDEGHFDKHVPLDEHGLSKYIIQKYIERMGTTFVDLRIFGIYGKYEEYSIRFISNMICKAIFDLPLTMKRNRRFSYLYVDDLAPVVDYFITHETLYEAYNVVPDDIHELRQIAELVLNVSGKQLPISSAESGYGLDYTGDNTRLRAEVPSLVFTALQDGIERLYSWYQSNQSLIDKSKLLVDR